MFILGIIIMICVSIIDNMGLTDALASVIHKIIRCPKCLTFWTTLIVLYYLYKNIMLAILIAITVSYLSYWFGLIIIMMSDLYENIWLKLNKKKRRK